MTKATLFISIAFMAIITGILPITAFAQESPADEVPQPYAGLENPFAWDDPTAQQAGKDIYQRSCLGCHGVSGSNISSADFSKTDYAQNLQENPDYVFWVLSEGRLSQGMPPYKSSLSEEQRWQVLTYLWLLGSETGPQPTPTEAPKDRRPALIKLTAPGEAKAGEQFTLSAALVDSNLEGISNSLVTFFFKVDFFTNGLMEIGEAITDEQGTAVLDYTPRLAGEIEVVARYGGDGFTPAEATAVITIVESEERFYEVEAGLHLPAPGKEVFIGPQSAKELGEMGKAPTSAFRLPGGILSWLLIYVLVLLSVWFAYFHVMYQVFHIGRIGKTYGTDVRLLPILGMLAAIGMGIMLALMILTGPNSHFHLMN